VSCSTLPVIMRLRTRRRDGGKVHIPVRNSVLMAPVSSLPSRYGELSGRGQDIFEGVRGLAGQLRDGVAHLSGVAVGAGASVLREE